MVRTEKLASVGRLSAGLAHEIGNPLGIIQGYIDLLSDSSINDGDRKLFSERALQELARINNLIRSLLDFSRTPTNTATQTTDIHSFLHDLLQTVRIRETAIEINYKTEFHATQSEVFIDSDGVRQIKEIWCNNSMNTSLPLTSFFIFYRFLWALATPLLTRSSRLKEGADERTLKKISFSKVDFWIHAASAGEAYIARQIIESFEEKQAFKILITTNTSQGRGILEKDLHKLQQKIQIAYMVFDNPALVKKAVTVADPKLLVLIELEIWPALMAEIKKQNKQILIVNGRMTQKSFNGYKKAAFLWRELKPDTILAISNDNKIRLETLFQQKKTYHVPNIKFDIMKECQIVESDNKKKQSLVLASIRKEEESEVLYVIQKILHKFPDLQIDLFPRHLHRVEHWVQHLTKTNISHALKTSDTDLDSCSVIIWNIFGQLTAAYQKADAAFVGGSLANLGGQNFMEAFMNGVIPVTGPSISNFLWTGDEVVQNGLLQKGANKEEVVELLTHLLQNPPDKKHVKQEADNYIRLKQGGSRKTCQYIAALLRNSDTQTNQ